MKLPKFSFQQARELLIGLFLFCSSFSMFAIPVVFNDVNFESFCLANFDADNDGIVDSGEVDTVTFLNISGMGISDLTGIEHFDSLVTLYALNNNLSTLDVSGNAYLKYLYADNNQLVSVQLPVSNRLVSLSLGNNQLTTLQITNKPLLNSMHLESNNLQSLNLGSLPSLANLFLNSNNLTTLDLSGATFLYGLYAQSNQLTSVNLSNSTGLRYVSLPYNNLNTLNINGLIHLKQLFMDGNPLLNLDTSTNVNLEDLRLIGTSLSQLDVSSLGSLRRFYASNSQLRSLNLKNSNNHNMIVCDLLSIPSLHCVEVDNPTAAQMGQGAYGLWQVPPSMTFDTFCPQYTYVPDDNFEQRIIFLTQETGPIDDYVLTSNISGVTAFATVFSSVQDFTGLEDFISLEELSLWGDGASSLDLSANPNLKIVTLIGMSQLSSLTLSESTNPNLESFALNSSPSMISVELKDYINLQTISLFSNASLSNLTIKDNLNVTGIDLKQMPLTQFTLSNCPAIEIFTVDNVGLTTLDVSSLNQLSILNCPNNQIQTLNVTNNANLIDLDCSNNQLSVLNISNGSNQNLLYFDAQNNPNLSCINVDDPIAATNALIVPYSAWSKDSAASYSDNCAATTGIYIEFDPDFQLCEDDCILLRDLLTLYNANCPYYTLDFYYLDQGQVVYVDGTGFSGTVPTVYYAVYTDQCTGFQYTDSINIEVLPSGSRECNGARPRPCHTGNSNRPLGEEVNVLIYPNPTIGTFTMGNESKEIIEYQIFDAYGNVWRSGTLKGLEHFEQNAPSQRGFYFIKFIETNGKRSLVKKLLVN